MSRKPEERDLTGYFHTFGRIIFNLVKQFVYKSTNKTILYVGEIPDPLYLAKSSSSINKWYILFFDLLLL